MCTIFLQLKTAKTKNINSVKSITNIQNVLNLWRIENSTLVWKINTFKRWIAKIRYENTKKIETT